MYKSRMIPTDQRRGYQVAIIEERTDETILFVLGATLPEVQQRTNMVLSALRTHESIVGEAPPDMIIRG